MQVKGSTESVRTHFSDALPTLKCATMVDFKGYLSEVLGVKKLRNLKAKIYVIVDLK